MLVATDCLSEGVNLQDEFQAVVHYDLAWNPTRHEQREGRVDRFGQPAEIVRALPLYGEDNGIDGIVLDVLLRKHESDPPGPRHQRARAAAERPGPGRAARGHAACAARPATSSTLDFGVDTASRRRSTRVAQQRGGRRRRSRTRFAQRTIRPDEVQEAVDAARDSLGEPGDVAAFASAPRSRRPGPW